METPHDGPIEFVQFMQVMDRLGDSWFAIAVLGVIAGFIVRSATTRKQNIGLIPTCLFGIVGAFLGVWLATRLGYAPTGTGTRFLAAMGGSILLTTIGGLFRRKEPPKQT
jgi:uncharacterized membrane protein YeaQ/YmgE (transglycosylase-associated protein family)